MESPTPAEPKRGSGFFAPIAKRPGHLVALGAGVLLGLVPTFDSIAQEAGEAAATESPAPQKLETLPTAFELWQDEQGFLWQLSRAGSLGSGESSYFQSALALSVRGTAFAPTEGFRLDGGQVGEEGGRLVLKQAGEELEIARDVWFDQERSGVRVLDTFTNPGQRKASFRIDLKTAYQNPWQDLHGTEGRILGSRPGTGLGPRDFGIVVKFSSAEGRHDTLFVTSSERDAKRPLISYSSNLRELTFSYDLEIEPGQSVSLLHWVVQRNLQKSNDAESVLRPFYQRRRLVAPRVEPDLAGGVRNFEAQAFPQPGAEPFDLEALVSLNEVLESLGADRRNEDVLWISGENQLAGTVNPEATLRVSTAWGDREVPLSQVAALQGGGRSGRTPRVFLRDGRVWSGNVVATGLTMKVAEGWEVEELRPEEMTLLLMRVAQEDGRPPEGGQLFVELRTGDVVAVGVEEADEEPLTVLTPWGEAGVPLSRVDELHYATGAVAPRFRLLQEDGSLWTVFLGQAALSLKERGTGSDPEVPLVVPPVTVAGAWKAGQAVGKAAVDLADEWFDLEDAVAWAGADLPGSAILLSGNNLFNGSLSMESLNVVSAGVVTPIAAGEVTAIRRSPDSDSEVAPIFEIELKGGEILTGRLRERMLLIESAGRQWQVPSKHFIAFQRQPDSGAE